eukprot:GEMP01031662.1.p1 GENE.GEMP01031662.1~~GEMP01031662.1.p1  ORF type:complete len:508 (+),score=86.38 GEMP01031662.1:371-1894(+)
MTQYRFSVKMFDFSATGLGAAEPYLKLDFDKFKLFLTDKEKGSNPEWGFKAAFMYRTKALEKLPTKSFRIFCFDASEKNPVEKVSLEVDLATLACGPPSVHLSLVDSNGEPAGMLKFMCVMKMYRKDFTVTFDRICLTMQSSPAPARLHISMNGETEVRVPYSATGEWEDVSITCEASLSDLLSIVEPACITVKAFDENQEVLVGEVQINLRAHASLEPTKSVTVEQDVVYSQKTRESGTVGEFSATLSYRNLPIYAQMEDGILKDNGVENGHLLFEGLPYPARCRASPPVVEDASLPEQRRIIPPVPGEKEDDEHNGMLYEGLAAPDVKDAELPPYWEMKKTLLGRPYFIDHRTMRTTWKDPRFLPENWDQRIDPDNGNIYYAYHKTRQTTYRDPRGANDNWDMRLSHKGQVYFMYMPLKIAHFSDPRGMPGGYEAVLDLKGRLYFRNHNEKTTQWKDPRFDASPLEKRQFVEKEHRQWWQAQTQISLENAAKEAQEAAEREEEDR